MAWAKNGTPYTEASTSDDMDITDLTAKKFNVFLAHSLASSNIKNNYTFDNNGNTDYARRRSYNGAADSTDTSATTIDNVGDGAWDIFEVIYSCNIDSEEKLNIHFYVNFNAAGESNAPNRLEAVSKVDTTTNTGQYTRIDSNNAGAGSYATGSNISAIGTD